MLDDLFGWVFAAIFLGIGRLCVALFSLGFARTQRDEDKLTFPFYGIAKDDDGKIVVSSGIASFIGVLAIAAAVIAAFILLNDIMI